jgi:hypothetical protein
VCRILYAITVETGTKALKNSPKLEWYNRAIDGWKSLFLLFKSIIAAIAQLVEQRIRNAFLCNKNNHLRFFVPGFVRLFVDELSAHWAK